MTELRVISRHSRLQRMTVGKLIPLLAGAAACAWANGGHATEPWVDARLPVKDGLVLWLDASQQNAVRQARQLPALSQGAELDLWFDGSGRGLHLSQGIAASRPHFRVDGGAATVAFDGKDDFLAASNVRGALSNLTLFIHAAPLSNVGGFRALLAMNELGRNDYTSGLTVDLGPGGTPDLSFLNV